MNKSQTLMKKISGSKPIEEATDLGVIGVLLKLSSGSSDDIAIKSLVAKGLGLGRGQSKNFFEFLAILKSSKDQKQSQKAMDGLKKLIKGKF